MEAEPGTEAEADGEGVARVRDGTDAGESGTEAELARLAAERDALRARLMESQQLLAEMPDLRAAREELEVLRASGWWRATAPLRRLTASVQREALPEVRLAIKRALLRLATRVRRTPEK
jgi:hypothetical protein